MIQIIDEAMAAGANGWAAQRLAGKVSIQRDYDGVLMISDMMSDDFYLTLAKALRKYDRGHIQYAQTSPVAAARAIRWKDRGRHGLRRPVGGERQSAGDFQWHRSEPTDQPDMYRDPLGSS